MISCEKSRMNRDKTVARDQVLAETTMLDMFYLADKFIRMELISEAPPSTTTCPSRNITDIDGNYPKTLIINYGPESCEDNFGTKRNGMLEVVLNGPYLESPTTATVTSVNFNSNGFQAEGTIVIGQRVIREDGTHTLKINTDGLKVDRGGDEPIWLSGVYELSWKEGFDNPNFAFDNLYKVKGESSGNSADGYEFVARTIEDLDYMFGCRWVKRGKTEITPIDFKTRTVDFGSGSCDNTAKLKIGNRDYDLSLR